MVNGLHADLTHFQGNSLQRQFEKFHWNRDIFTFQFAFPAAICFYFFSLQTPGWFFWAWAPIQIPQKGRKKDISSDFLIPHQAPHRNFDQADINSKWSHFMLNTSTCRALTWNISYLFLSHNLKMVIAWRSPWPNSVRAEPCRNRPRCGLGTKSHKQESFGEKILVLKSVCHEVLGWV